MIVISEFMDEQAIKRHLADFETIYEPDLVDRQDDLLNRVNSAKALIVRNRTQVTAELLAAAPNLKCVGRLGVGLDSIDMEACKNSGVDVYPALGANDLSVAEYVITTGMMLQRAAYYSQNEMLTGQWPRQACSGYEIAGLTLGLIGMGSIARLTSELADKMGMTVMGHDPYLPADHPIREMVSIVDLEPLLQQSDIVSLHVPLTEETRHLIGRSELDLMNKRSVLINAARGGIVDETALVEALKSGQIAGAALDVFENEPLDEKNASKFKNIPNLVLTPHIAGVTKQSNERVSDMIASKVAECLKRG